MSKILVFSDSHGVERGMRSAIEEHRAGCELVIHLGDGLREIERLSGLYPELPLIAIKGNHETRDKSVRLLNIRGLKLMCIHGHTFGVKFGLDYAAKAAINEGADILLYGHTHIAYNSVYTLSDGRSVHLFNPGSAGYGFQPSYGIMEFSNFEPYKTYHVKL